MGLYLLFKTINNEYIPVPYPKTCQISRVCAGTSEIYCTRCTGSRMMRVFSSSILNTQFSKAVTLLEPNRNREPGTGRFAVGGLRLNCLDFVSGTEPTSANSEPARRPVRFTRFDEVHQVYCTLHTSYIRLLYATYPSWNSLMAVRRFPGPVRGPRTGVAVRVGFFTTRQPGNRELVLLAGSANKIMNRAPEQGTGA